MNKLLKATGQLAKTDAIDAKILAHFAEAIRPHLTKMSDESSHQLKDLVQCRRQISEMIAAEKNRLRGKSASVASDVQSHIEWLEKHLREIETQISEAIALNEASVRFGEGGLISVVCCIWQLWWRFVLTQ